MARNNMLALQWVLNNSKLKKVFTQSGGRYRTVGWGLPADFAIPGGGNTCPGAGACRGVCFAKQGAYTFRSVVAARKRALAQTLRDSFTGHLVDDLRTLERRGFNVVRIHDSGDFYAQRYLDSWKEALTAVPGVIGYAYTKSFHLDIWGDLPGNLRIVQSLAGRFDARVKFARPHSRIFATVDAMESAGYVSGYDSDLPAIEGVTRIGLPYHGTKNLTPAQEGFFS